MRNKKRWKLIIFLIIFSICIGTLEQYKNEDVVSTISIPVTNKVIVVDAGHRKSGWWSSKQKWNK